MRGLAKFVPVDRRIRTFVGDGLARAGRQIVNSHGMYLGMRGRRNALNRDAVVHDVMILIDRIFVVDCGLMKHAVAIGRRVTHMHEVVRRKIIESHESEETDAEAEIKSGGNGDAVITESKPRIISRAVGQRRPTATVAA